MINYFDAAENTLRSRSMLEKALKNLMRRQERIMRHNAPSGYPSLDTSKPYTSTKSVNDALTDCIEIAEVAREINRTKDKIDEIDSVLQQLDPQDAELLRLWYIERKSKEEIAALEEEQAAAAHLRPLQKRLAKEITVMVHSLEDYEAAVEASNILFGNSTHESLMKLDEDTLLAVFEGVPQFEISRDELSAGVKVIDLLTEKAAVFASKGEMRKLVQSGGISVNKEKLADAETVIDCSSLLNEKYLLVQRGKKNYYLLIAK